MIEDSTEGEASNEGRRDDEGLDESSSSSSSSSASSSCSSPSSSPSPSGVSPSPEPLSGEGVRFKFGFISSPDFPLLDSDGISIGAVANTMSCSSCVGGAGGGKVEDMEGRFAKGRGTGLRGSVGDRRKDCFHTYVMD
jgi:hypothetical protein